MNRFKDVNNAMAKGFDDRHTLYSDNQVSLIGDDYNIDENLDAVTDFSFSNPDFLSVQFRSNLVLRWEYIPGSEIFLVWSQDISQSGDFNQGLFENLENNVFGSKKPQNIFLLKATYRFVL